MLKVANSVINASQIKTPIAFVGDVTLSTGNLVIGTAGKGVDFTATSSGSGTMTSELLADYEEGTWTPTQGAGLTVVGAFTSSGTYTKIGRQVYVAGQILGATSIATTTASLIIGGLPFTSVADGIGSAVNLALSQSSALLIFGGDTNIYCVSAVSGPNRIYFSATYTV